MKSLLFTPLVFCLDLLPQQIAAQEAAKQPNVFEAALMELGYATGFLEPVVFFRKPPGFRRGRVGSDAPSPRPGGGPFVGKAPEPELGPAGKVRRIEEAKRRKKEELKRTPKALKKALDALPRDDSNSGPCGRRDDPRCRKVDFGLKAASKGDRLR